MNLLPIGVDFMLTIEKLFSGRTFTIESYPLEKTAFFDIETTGFVADKSFLYLIGCCYYKDRKWHLIQWFAENPIEEKDVLNAFVKFIKAYDVCIHFNGTTFDIPYVTRKCKMHDIPYFFEDLYSIDLYRTACTYKSLLHLDRCNQKSVERALCLDREDMYTGGELIQVYANYVGLSRLEQLQKGKKSLVTDAKVQKPEEDSAQHLLSLLLLHNEEDLKGLVYISSLFSYDQLLHGNYSVTDLSLDSENRIFFSLSLAEKLPISFYVNEYGIEIKGSEYLCTIKIPLFEGTLKHYMNDYKNYYYLPYEDTVVLKSIAASMDKSYRERATRDNCYVKKTALFLPQFSNEIQPIFFHDRKDTIAFFECTDERLQDECFLNSYTIHILTSLLSTKRTK